jgi:hypothetical protein
MAQAGLNRASRDRRFAAEQIAGAGDGRSRKQILFEMSQEKGVWAITPHPTTNRCNPAAGRKE